MAGVGAPLLEQLVEALALMATGQVDRETLVTHRFPLTRVAEAFRAQCSPDAIKVMLVPEASG